MTEKPTLDFARLFESLDELKEQVELLKDSVEDRLKEIELKLQQIKAFQSGTLEANQKIIYKELKKIQHEEIEEGEP